VAGTDQFPNVNIFDLNAQLGPDGKRTQFLASEPVPGDRQHQLTKGKHGLKFGFDAGSRFR
jgi:hypothetical protein